MNSIDRYTPFDYSDDDIYVYFEVADTKNAFIVLHSIDFLNEIFETEYGFNVLMCYQQIPEVIRELSAHNIAIYSVIPSLCRDKNQKNS